MKNCIVVIGFGALLIFFSSCKKDTATRNTANAAVTGTWELENVQSGMVPNIYYSPGNGNLVAFTDSMYKKYTNGNLSKSGYYTIVPDTSAREETGILITPGQYTNRIIFDNDTVSHKTYIEISNNKLSFLSGFFPSDGGSSLSYRRK